MNHFPPDPAILMNESDVEQKFVWPLLTASLPNGLGLPPSLIRTKPNLRDFEIEKRQNKKRYFPDHVVIIRGLPVAVWEAKPPSDDLADAVLECRLYATELNALYPPGINPCRFCVVTNGLQTELRTSDSDTVLASFCLADANPASPEFAAFLTKVSYESLTQSVAEQLRKASARKYHRPVRMVGGTSLQDEQVPYNEFGKLLSSEFQHLFNPSSYEDRFKIVENAYVKTQRRERYVDEIDRIIRLASPPKVQEAQWIEDTGNPVPIVAKLGDLESLRNKILLLVGAVGSGKSTFVDYLQRIALPEEVRERIAWARIDLNDAPVSKDEIYAWCRRHLAQGIRDSSPDQETESLVGLRKLYRKEIETFDKWTLELFSKDSDEYKKRLADEITKLKQDQDGTLQALERHLCTGRGRLLIVVLDNCDKRDRDEQLLMFEVARWLQQQVRCLVMLPLRHITFENHRNEPPLDTALKDLIYRIEPPPFQKVLQNRLSLVLREAKASSKALNYVMAGKLVQFQADQLDKFLGIMMGSLFDHRRHGKNIIVGLAGWNIRRAFEMFLEFCRSGYISEQDIFASQATGQQMHLPQGVVTRMLLRGHHRYYDGNRSWVKNVFQCEPEDPNPDHLVRYRILRWLQEGARSAGPSGYRGYHRVNDLIEALSALGTDEAAVRRECSYLLHHGCILAEHLKRELLSDDDLVTLTPAGHVHLELTEDFHYLAASAEDTWIADEPTAKKIHQRIVEQPRWKSQRWPVILQSAADFAKYLDSWSQSSPSVTAHYLPAPPEELLTPALSQIEQQSQKALQDYRASRQS
jgi:energy-coupling factor transporter ATP-binding protein EcfA2